mmetsp:Transcript_15301/g.61529  ORF Transcript_15301/g.61529 Transcript_15301/m.61529 type:complete len:491 (-) Transcript_15301:175-1647(-)
MSSFQSETSSSPAETARMLPATDQRTRQTGWSKAWTSLGSQTASSVWSVQTRTVLSSEHEATIEAGMPVKGAHETSRTHSAWTLPSSRERSSTNSSDADPGVVGATVPSGAAPPAPEVAARAASPPSGTLARQKATRLSHAPVASRSASTASPSRLAPTAPWGPQVTALQPALEARKRCVVQTSSAGEPSAAPWWTSTATWPSDEAHASMSAPCSIGANSIEFTDDAGDAAADGSAPGCADDDPLAAVPVPDDAVPLEEEEEEEEQHRGRWCSALHRGRGSGVVVVSAWARARRDPSKSRVGTKTGLLRVDDDDDESVRTWRGACGRHWTRERAVVFFCCRDSTNATREARFGSHNGACLVATREGRPRRWRVGQRWWVQHVVVAAAVRGGRRGRRGRDGVGRVVVRVVVVARAPRAVAERLRRDRRRRGRVGGAVVVRDEGRRRGRPGRRREHRGRGGRPGVGDDDRGGRCTLLRGGVVVVVFVRRRRR